MVLQRDTACRVWGTATPRANVTVEVAGHAAIATADKDGRWMASLPPTQAGGPFTMTVSTTSTHGDGIPEAVTFNDVLFGDIWVCSGQSNMEWPLRATIDADKYIADSADNGLRLLTFERRTSATPVDDPKTNAWSVAGPGTTPDFSAVGYHFGEMLRERLKDANGKSVPIGLIHTSWGGTLCEAWMPVPALKAGGFDSIVARLADFEDKDGKRAAQAAKAMKAYTAFYDNLLGSPELPADPTWTPTTIPGDWQQNHPNFDGMIAYRKTLTLSEDWARAESTLSLGAIDDYDGVTINGVPVGHTGPDTPTAWVHPRVYTLPAGTFHAGENTITVFAVDAQGFGGFSGQPEQLTLVQQYSVKNASGSENGVRRIGLAGEWASCVVGSIADLKFPPAPQVGGPNPTTRPGTLYNAMLHPMKDLAVTGAIWYQGESNAGRAEQYRTLFPTMIESWRAAFKDPDMPFYFVQLANFMKRVDEPQESAWAELREAQTMTLDLPHTGMATSIDIGEANDIHPKNKHDVGRRLARNALAEHYGLDVVPCGPMLRGEPGLRTVNTIETRPGKPSYPVLTQEAVLDFDFADGLSTTDGQPPRGFEVCAPGKDKPFVMAEARIEDGQIILSVKNLPGIESVRYAWADNPDVNLVNSEGLPAVPFRTDDRPGVTHGRE